VSRTKIPDKHCIFLGAEEKIVAKNENEINSPAVSEQRE
jgi:hypothetical protein